MNELVSIQSNEIVASLDAIIKYSNNKEESVRKMILKYRSELEGLGSSDSRISNPMLKVTLLPKKVGGVVDWKRVVLNEEQSMFLLTLLSNTKEVVKFKLNLIKQFSTMRKELVEIEHNTLVKFHKEEMTKLANKKREMNTYDGGLMSVSKIKKELQLPEKMSFIWLALAHARLVNNIHETHEFHYLAEDVPEYIGNKQPKGTSPILLPAAVKEAIDKYTAYLESLHTEDD